MHSYCWSCQILFEHVGPFLIGLLFALFLCCYHFFFPWFYILSFFRSVGKLVILCTQSKNWFNFRFDMVFADVVLILIDGGLISLNICNLLDLLEHSWSWWFSRYFHKHCDCWLEVAGCCFSYWCSWWVLTWMVVHILWLCCSAKASGIQYWDFFWGDTLFTWSPVVLFYDCKNVDSMGSIFNFQVTYMTENQPLHPMVPQLALDQQRPRQFPRSADLDSMIGEPSLLAAKFQEEEQFRRSMWDYNSNYGFSKLIIWIF